MAGAAVLKFHGTGKTRGKKEFLKIVEERVAKFPDNTICNKVISDTVTMADYHQILLMIFHQTFYGPSTFALAAAHCQTKHHKVREYLMHHADEEKSHWNWVVSDLKKTGYNGPNPVDTLPKTACQAYIAFNFFVATHHPLARLAIATVLESIGASFGKKYATRLCKNLKLTPDKAQFFFGHGDTDVGHTAEIIKVIDGCELSPDEWNWMCHSAETAGKLYQAMYEEALSDK